MKYLTPLMTPSLLNQTQARRSVTMSQSGIFMWRKAYGLLIEDKIRPEMSSTLYGIQEQPYDCDLEIPEGERALGSSRKANFASKRKTWTGS